LLTLAVNNGKITRRSPLDNTEISYNAMAKIFLKIPPTNRDAAKHDWHKKSGRASRCRTCFCSVEDSLDFCPGFFLDEEAREAIRKAQVVCLTDHYDIVCRRMASRGIEAVSRR